jgi:hypothetical protein
MFDANRASCARCVYFSEPKPVPKIGANVDRGARVFVYGTCKRFPAAVEKLPADFCGEYMERVSSHERVTRNADQGEQRQSA